MICNYPVKSHYCIHPTTFQFTINTQPLISLAYKASAQLV